MNLNLTTATRYGLNVLALLGTSVALYLGSSIFIPVTISVLLATILYPAASWFHSRLRFPWFLACLVSILGLVFLVMTMTGAFLLRNPPPGYVPEGWEPSMAPVRAVASARDYEPSEVLRSRTFPLLWVAYALGASSGLMVISQLVPFAKEKGLGAASSLALFVGAAGSVAGRTLSGWMSDGVGRLNVLRLMIGLSIVAMLMFYSVSATAPGFLMMVFVVYW